MSGIRFQPVMRKMTGKRIPLIERSLQISLDDGSDDSQSTQLLYWLWLRHMECACYFGRFARARISADRLGSRCSGSLSCEKSRYVVKVSIAIDAMRRRKGLIHE
jgi:hypothetical protein